MHNNQTSATVISTTTHEKNLSEDRLHLKDVTHESQTTNGHVNHQFRTKPSYSKMIGSTFPNRSQSKSLARYIKTNSKQKTMQNPPALHLTFLNHDGNTDPSSQTTDQQSKHLR